MFDIFRNERRASGVMWLGIAKDLEDAKSRVKKFYAEHHAVYFAFDQTTQARHIFTLEELTNQGGKRRTP